MVNEIDVMTVILIIARSVCLGLLLVIYIIASNLFEISVHQF